MWILISLPYIITCAFIPESESETPLNRAAWPHYLLLALLPTPTNSLGFFRAFSTRRVMSLICPLVIDYQLARLVTRLPGWLPDYQVGYQVTRLVTRLDTTLVTRLPGWLPGWLPGCQVGYTVYCASTRWACGCVNPRICPLAIDYPSIELWNSEDLWKDS